MISEETSFENVEDADTDVDADTDADDGRWTTAYPISFPGAFGSGELNLSEKYILNACMHSTSPKPSDTFILNNPYNSL